MKKLKLQSYPPKLTQYRCLGDLLPVLSNERELRLAQFSGYPVASNILAHVRQLLIVPDVAALKVSLLGLRDCARYASMTLLNMPSLRIDRYQMNFLDVYNYVRLHRLAAGFGHLSTIQLQLVAYLITSSEEQDASWILEFEPAPSTNFFMVMRDLYRSAFHGNASADLSLDLTGGLSAIADPGMIVYAAEHDNFVTVDSVILTTTARQDAINTLTSGTPETVEALQSRLDAEVLAHILADVRLVDHVFTLLMDTNIWSEFVTPRPRPDATTNVERARGLSYLAGYIQTLFLYPQFLRYELYRQSYFRLEAWHGGFPALSPEIETNYQKFIREYDYLNAEKDIKDLFASFDHDKDDAYGCQVFTMFREVAALYAVTSIINNAMATLPAVASFAMNDLTALTGSPAYDAILLATPIATINLIDPIANRILNAQQFEATTVRTSNYVALAITDIYRKEVVTKVSTAGYTPWMDLKCQIACSYDAINGNRPALTLSSTKDSPNRVTATALAERRRQVNDLGRVYSAQDYVRTRGSLPNEYPDFFIDEARVAKLHGQIPLNWNTLYPASLFEGDRLYNVLTIGSASIELDNLLETIIGSHIASIRRMLLSEAIARHWVTLLSSGMLVYRLMEGADPSNASAWTIVNGWGRPYGISYSQLHAIQPATSNLLHIRGTIFAVRFLHNIPGPGADMTFLQDYPLQTYGFAFPGEGSYSLLTESPINAPGDLSAAIASGAAPAAVSSPTAAIDTGLYYVLGSPLKHFGLSPRLSVTYSIPANMFDRRYAYRMDELLIHLDPSATFGDAPEATRNTTSLAEKQWPGTKMVPLLDYVTPAGYTGGSPGSSTGNTGGAGSPDDIIKSLVEKTESDLKNNHVESIKQAEAKPLPGATLEAEAVGETDKAKPSGTPTSDPATGKSKTKRKGKGKSKAAPSVPDKPEAGKKTDPLDKAASADAIEDSSTL